jgi:hypothetical protein
MDRFLNLPVLKHVYGHQDKDIAYADLPLDAQMNIEADALATVRMLLIRLNGNRSARLQLYPSGYIATDVAC